MNAISVMPIARKNSAISLRAKNRRKGWDDRLRGRPSLIGSRSGLL
jgi:hypothetical protein